MPDDFIESRRTWWATAMARHRLAHGSNRGHFRRRDAEQCVPEQVVVHSNRDSALPVVNGAAEGSSERQADTPVESVPRREPPA